MPHALATPRIQGSPLHRYKMSSGRLCYGNAANGVSVVPIFPLVPLSPGKGQAFGALHTLNERLPPPPPRGWRRLVLFWAQAPPRSSDGGQSS